MDKQQIIKDNAANGYIHVKEFDGYDIYKKQNQAGGWTYYCDKIGNEGSFILWDTALYGENELMAILNDILNGND